MAALEARSLLTRETIPHRMPSPQPGWAASSEWWAASDRNGGPITSEPWAPSDRNRWAAYVGIRIVALMRAFGDKPRKWRRKTPRIAAPISSREHSTFRTRNDKSRSQADRGGQWLDQMRSRHGADKSPRPGARRLDVPVQGEAYNIFRLPKLMPTGGVRLPSAQRLDQRPLGAREAP